MLEELRFMFGITFLTCSKTCFLGQVSLSVSNFWYAFQYIFWVQESLLSKVSDMHFNVFPGRSVISGGTVLTRIFTFSFVISVLFAEHLQDESFVAFLVLYEDFGRLLYKTGVCLPLVAAGWSLIVKPPLPLQSTGKWSHVCFTFQIHADHMCCKRVIDTRWISSKSYLAWKNGPHIPKDK